MKKASLADRMAWFVVVEPLSSTLAEMTSTLVGIVEMQKEVIQLGLDLHLKLMIRHAAERRRLIGAVVSPEPLPKKPYHKHRGETLDQALMEANSTVDLVHSLICPDEMELTPCEQPAAGVKRGFPHQITCMICFAYSQHVFRMAKQHAGYIIGKLWASC